VAIAIGQDFRALEAGAHAYAAYKKKEYTPLTRYQKTRTGDIEGFIELPLAVGLIGGAVKTHPLAQINLKLLKVKSANELAMAMAAVGLAQNFAAMRALSTEGIQKGHMRLHARNLAVIGGATGGDIEAVAAQMVAEKNVSATRAKEIVDGFGKQKG
jgi:hydroxymethylglutaryl-CoA reductase